MSGGVRVGLDIGGSKVHGVAVDATDAHVLAQVRRPVARGRDGVVASAAAVVSELRAAVGDDVVVSVGVGVPGTVDGAGVVHNAVNLGLDRPLSLADVLSSTVGVPVVVENDVNVASLGAARWLQDKGEPPDLALLNIGTGMAAGLVLDGALRRGWRGTVGEIGHLPVVADGPRCSCGQHGCLELFASGGGVARQWPYDGPLPQPRALFDAADEGDAEAIAVRDAFVSWVGHAVRILATVTDVRWIALGGGVTRLGRDLLDPVDRALAHARADSPFVASLRLDERLTMLPPDYPAAPLGAAALEGETTWKS